MNTKYIPLLQIQRDLCDVPRGEQRFDAYLRTLRGKTTDDMELPLAVFNPMGREHVAARLDEYLALDADIIASDAVANATSTLKNMEGSYKVGLVLADDAKGGWTNRYATEFEHRYGSQALYQRGWTTGMLWTSEQPTAEIVRCATAEAVLRVAYVRRNGLAQSLRDMLLQSAFVATGARSILPACDPEELEYSKEVIEPNLDSEVRAVQIACLFGDDAAHQLGYEPLGLSGRAGLVLAANDPSFCSCSFLVRPAPNQ